jgi:hypothetical protein
MSPGSEGFLTSDAWALPPLGAGISSGIRRDRARPRYSERAYMPLSHRHDLWPITGQACGTVAGVLSAGARRRMRRCLLHLASLGGHRQVVELLLDSGVDVNKPSAIRPLIFVTPLCAARLRRRRETEALLLQRGAREDIFTGAFLGDVNPLHKQLEQEPSAAQAVDPDARDDNGFTPLDWLERAAKSVDRAAVRNLLSQPTRVR